MKIAIISNIVEDEIVDKNGKIIRSVGGPPFYCGIIARKYGLDVELVTKYGNDLSKNYLELLKRNNILVNSNSVSKFPTTRFLLQNSGLSRDLILKSQCEALNLEEIQNVNADSLIISPVLDELPLEGLKKIIENKKSKFIMFDPQGYTRIIGVDGKITTKKYMNLPIKNVDSIKLDLNELSCFSGGLFGKAGTQKIISSYNIRFILYTEDLKVHMFNGTKHYWLNIPKINTFDSTGVGDILTATFTSILLNENDSIWAFCFAVGAVTSALRSMQHGIKKIPEKKKIEENASYNYNLLNFEII